MRRGHVRPRSAVSGARTDGRRVEGARRGSESVRVGAFLKPSGFPEPGGRSGAFVALAALLLTATCAESPSGGNAEHDGDTDIGVIDVTSDARAEDSEVEDVARDLVPLEVSDVLDESSGCGERGSIGCPCTSDAECESGLCVAIGFDDGRVCTEFCDGSCSEAGYSCRPWSRGGRDVDVCFPIVVQCLPCADNPGCGADVNACIGLDDGDFCANGCARHGFCPPGSTCTSIDDAGEDKVVCVPDGGVCTDCLDRDGDRHGIGRSCLGEDCDDRDPATFAGAHELCDGRDNDCDLEVDETFDFASDPAHCGGCGVVCRADDAATSCDSGECVISRCEDGFGDCNGDPTDGCETDLNVSTLCGACADLPGTPGQACGACGRGTWSCQSDGTLACVGDPGVGAHNACGGCDPLTGAPGEVCAPCSTWTCTDDGGVACEVASDALNVCGGCGELTAEPGSPCGTCDSGAWSCLADSLVCVGDAGSAAVNACGTCSDLEGTPGDECAPCSAWACSEDGSSVACEAVVDALNACGGCGALPAVPGEACGTCALGRWECAGETLVCAGDPGHSALNVCGGCEPTVGAPGDACGTCGAGALICDGDTLSCDDPGAAAQNACGGCANLAVEPGSPCGTCDLGVYACGDDDESVTCEGVPSPPPATCVVVRSVRTGFPVGSAAGGGFTGRANARSSLVGPASGAGLEAKPFPTE